MSKIPKIGSFVYIEENGKRIRGTVTCYSSDPEFHGSKKFKKKYVVHWDDGRITEEG